MIKALVKVLVLAAVVATPTWAVAGKNDTEWNPPTRYDHTYTGELTIHLLPQAEVVKACKELLPTANYITTKQRGCARWYDNNTCTIIAVDKTFMGATPKAVIRHETGHCNGWGAHHPD